MQINFAMATDIAKRETNQDRVFGKVCDICHIKNVPRGIFCVADGMGGLQDGEYAASVAVGAFEAWWEDGFKRGDSLESVFWSINDTIRQRAQAEKVLHGTTCSVLVIEGDQYQIVHAGDSRIYMIESKWPAFLNPARQLTEDHNWAEDQKRKGILSQQEISSHPKKNLLTSCLGTFERPRIYTCAGTIKSPCSFLLCSDGLYRYINSKKLAALFRSNKDCETLSEKLIAYALKQGAGDNVSVVVVRPLCV